jgi:hypothetical protein
MPERYFNLAAVLLIALALASTARQSLSVLHVSWTSWLCAAILSWFIGKVLDGFVGSK